MVLILLHGLYTVTKTSGQSNLTQDRIAATDGWFNRIRHVAPICPYGRHTGATWWIRLNLCFLQPTWVHNPNGKSIGSAVFAQLMAESPYTLHFILFPLKIALSNGGSGHYLIHRDVGPPKSSTQTASWSVQPFLQGSLVWQTDRPTDWQTMLLSR